MEWCIGRGVWSAPKGRDHNALGLGTPLGLQKQTTAWSLIFPVCLVGVPGDPTYPLGRCSERQECL